MTSSNPGVFVTIRGTLLLRRALPVAAMAAAFALVPGAASAMPESAPVVNSFFTSYQALATIELTDGRTVQATVSRLPAIDGTGWNSSLLIWVRPAGDCHVVGDCDSGTGLGSVALSADELHFDRGLRKVTVDEVTIDLRRFNYNDVRATEETVSVSLAFTGTGPVTRSAEHSQACGVGGECQALRLSSQRAADATMSLGDASGQGSGSLSVDKSVDVAASKDGDGGTPPPPPADGDVAPPPSNGSGDLPADGSYPLPPADGSDTSLSGDGASP